MLHPLGSRAGVVVNAPTTSSLIECRLTFIDLNLIFFSGFCFRVKIYSVYIRTPNELRKVPHKKAKKKKNLKWRSTSGQLAPFCLLRRMWRCDAKLVLSEFLRFQMELDSKNLMIDRLNSQMKQSSLNTSINDDDAPSVSGK